MNSKIKEIISDLHEFNPMLGFRGCRLGVKYPEISEMQANAIMDAAIECKKAGIKVGIFFILGLVGETKQDMENTIKYAYKLRELGADNFHFSIATPLYGTQLYEQAKNGGFLKEEFGDEALARAHPLIETSEFTGEDVLQYCLRANEINQRLTKNKIMKAIRDPKKAMKIIKTLIFKQSQRS